MNQTLKINNLLRCYTSRCVHNQLINNHQMNFVQPILNQSIFNQHQMRTLTRGRTSVLREMKKRSKDFDVVPHKLRHRREWLDWNYDCEIFAFNNRLKEKFNEQTLKKAFICKSYSEQQNNEEQDEELEILSQIQLENNEEFINSGLELCNRFISQYLRYFLRNVPEEGISAIKNYLLSTEPLSDMATKIGCTDLIFSKEFPVEKETLASTMLSLVGALKHDTDEKHTTKFIIDFIMTYLYSIDIMDIWSIENPEKLVKSILKTNNINDFDYRILRQTGINAILPSYLIGVYVNKNLLGFGPGCTIEESKQMAAYDCLRRLFNLNVANMNYEFGVKAYDLDYSKFDKPNPSLNNFKISELDRFK